MLMINICVWWCRDGQKEMIFIDFICVLKLYYLIIRVVDDKGVIYLVLNLVFVFFGVWKLLYLCEQKIINGGY